MPVTKKTIYECTDGTGFDDEKEAELYEAKLQIKTQIMDWVETAFAGFDSRDRRAITDFVMDNAYEIGKLFQEIYNYKK